MDEKKILSPAPASDDEYHNRIAAISMVFEKNLRGASAQSGLGPQPTVLSARAVVLLSPVGSYLRSDFEGKNLTPQTWFDIQQRRPDGFVQERLNWQQGISVKHSTNGLALGDWTIVGARAHEGRADHSGPYREVTAGFRVGPPSKSPAGEAGETYRELGAGRSNEQFVSLVYKAILGREADTASRYWVDMLNERWETRHGALEAFLESPEAREKHLNNKDFLEQMQAALGRSPDAEESEKWLAALERGRSRLSVAEEVFASLTQAE